MEIKTVQFEGIDWDYIISEAGIQRSKKGKENFSLMSQQYIVVESSFREKDTNDLFYQLKYSSGKRMNKALISEKVLADSRKIIKIGQGIKINSKNSKNFIEFFDDYIHYFGVDDNPKEIARDIVWDDEGKLIGINSDIELVHDQYKKALEPKGSWEKWLSLAKPIWNGSLIEVFEILKLGASISINANDYLTPICELLGKSGIGKTNMFVLGASMFGDPKVFVTSGNTTKKALNLKCQNLGVFPNYIDEGELIRCSADFKFNGSDSWIYELSEGKGRNRLVKNDVFAGDYKNEDVNTWHNLISISSEKSLIDFDQTQIGVINRVVSVYARKEDLQLRDISGFYKNYGWFIRKLLELPECNRDNLVEMYNTVELDEEIKETIANKQLPLVKHFAVSLYLTEQILGKCKYDINDLSVLFTKEKSLCKNDTYAEAIMSFVSRNKDKFFDTREDVRDDYDGLMSSNAKKKVFNDFYGFIKMKFIWLDRQVLNDFLKSKYKLTFDDLKKELSDSGIIIPWVEKNGKKIRYVKRAANIPEIFIKTTCVRIPINYFSDESEGEDDED